MKKNKFFIQIITNLIIIFLFIGCNKDSDDNLCACGMQLPVKEIPWLGVLKAGLKANPEISSAMIVLYNWNSQDFFYVTTAVSGLHDIPDTVYDCTGNEILRCEGNSQTDNCISFISESEKIGIIWKKWP